jgi:alginate O-acetyltransferase complex protein AlgI
MSFVSASFLIFLAVAWACFFVAPTKIRPLIVTLASYVFYGSWSLPFLAMILLTTSVDYICSHVISRAQSQLKKQVALVSAIVINALVLGFFKYLNFLLGSTFFFVSYCGSVSPLPKHLEIILPLGISFYTFEAISYVVDVYQGRSAPAKNFWEYNFYIMYFPHLISGPIIRYAELCSQYATGIQRASWERIGKGFELIVLGYTFKILIADRCGTNVDPIFYDPHHASSLASCLAAAAFRAQLYFDFLGYTHIARGVSLLFNIELPVNFNHPFSATNISNFWERWHMSLSRWIRDYLFRPLGGSRLGLPRTLLNIFIVFALAGAWHGAGWTYIAWGVFHGFVLVLYQLFVRLRPLILKSKDALLLDNKLYRAWSIWFTYAVGTTGIVIFRAQDIGTALQVLGNMFNLNRLSTELTDCFIHNEFAMLFSIAFVIFLCLGGELVTKLYYARFQPLSLALKIPAAAGILLLCWIMNGAAAQPFIYFQF